MTDSRAWQSHIPHDYLPFWFHISKLPEAMTSLIASARSDSANREYYIVPYTKVECRDFETWTWKARLNYKCLTAEDGPEREAENGQFDRLRSQVCNFARERGLNIDLDFHAVHSLLADCQITFVNSTGQKTVFDIEMKFGTCFKEENGALLLFQDAGNANPPQQDPFWPTQAWHFLVIENIEAGFVYILPRDVVHDDWSEFQSKATQKWNTVPLSEINQFRLEWEENWFEKAWKIMSRYVDAPPARKKLTAEEFRALLERWQTTPDASESFDGDDKLNADQDEPEGDNDSVSGHESNKDLTCNAGSMLIDEATYQLACEQKVRRFTNALLKECAHQGFGVVLPLGERAGLGKKAYIFAPYAWTDQDVACLKEWHRAPVHILHDNFPLDMQVLPLSFSPMNWGHCDFQMPHIESLRQSGKIGKGNFVTDLLLLSSPQSPLSERIHRFLMTTMSVQLATLRIRPDASLCKILEAQI